MSGSRPGHTRAALLLVLARPNSPLGRSVAAKEYLAAAARAARDAELYDWALDGYVAAEWVPPDRAELEREAGELDELIEERGAQMPFELRGIAEECALRMRAAAAAPNCGRASLPRPVNRARRRRERRAEEAAARRVRRDLPGAAQVQLTYDLELGTHECGTHFVIRGEEVCLPSADIVEHEPSSKTLVVWGTSLGRDR